MKEKLVSYRNLPYGRKISGIFNVVPITKEEFEAKKNELEYVRYDNYYMPRMYLQVTGRCNFKCKHCFAATDNNPLVTELSLEQIEELFKMASEVGICGLTITGGEPTVHPHLKEILRLMKKYDLGLLDFNTNGYLFDEEYLDLFKELGMDPNIKISIDGLGSHDEFRGVKGSEEKALKALKLVVEKGFRGYTQTQVNRSTMDHLPALFDEVEDYGLTSIRLIKTTGTPRWNINGKSENYTFQEFYEEMFHLIDYQVKKGHKTPLDIWQLGWITPANLKASSFTTEKVKDRYFDNELCPAYHRMISIGSDGNVYPCLEMQGIVNGLGYSYGNVFKDGLKNILNKGPYIDIQKLTAEERFEHNKECIDCEYRDICSGGCPALGLIYSKGDFLGMDKSCCELFKSGLYDRYKKYFETGEF